MSNLSLNDEFIANQLVCVFTDIFPDAVKIGMVYGNNSAKVIADKLNFYKAKNIVTDPVMVSTSGSRLISEQGLENLKKYLLPISALATPNVPEAEILSGINIKNLQDMQNAAKIISDKNGCAVLWTSNGASTPYLNPPFYPRSRISQRLSRRADKMCFPETEYRQSHI